jgi:hypothetical protein
MLLPICIHLRDSIPSLARSLVAAAGRWKTLLYFTFSPRYDSCLPSPHSIHLSVTPLLGRFLPASQSPDWSTRRIDPCHILFPLAVWLHIPWPVVVVDSLDG